MTVTLRKIDEDLNRLLNGDGEIAVSALSNGDFTPANTSNPADAGTDEKVTLRTDSDGNLAIRGASLSDEGSFRDDFTGSSLSTNLTGTITFTNGSSDITGVGSLFTSELNRDHYVKISTDTETSWVKVSRVLSDTAAVLDSPYVGTGGAGTGQKSYWETVTGTGTITVSNSKLVIGSGVNSGNRTQISRLADYGPMLTVHVISILNRVSGQELYFGYQDNEVSPVNKAQVIFDGRDSSLIKLRTSNGSSSYDTEDTLVALPVGLYTYQNLRYEFEISPKSVALFVNDILVARNRLHIPAPYAVMRQSAGVVNSAVVANNTMSIDMVFLSNFNTTEVTGSSTANPIAVKTVDSSLALSIDEQSQWMLRRAVKLLEALQTVDGAKRLRIVVDNISTGTIATVSAVTTVGSVTNIPTIGGNDARQTYKDYSRVAYNTGIRNNLVFS